MADTLAPFFRLSLRLLLFVLAALLAALAEFVGAGLAFLPGRLDACALLGREQVEAFGACLLVRGAQLLAELAGACLLLGRECPALPARL